MHTMCKLVVGWSNSSMGHEKGSITLPPVAVDLTPSGVGAVMALFCTTKS